MAIRLFIVAAALAVLVPTAGFAAPKVCAERDSIIDKLKNKYGEAERGMGLSGSEAMIEIWSSEKTGTWTIVMTRPDGVSCVMAAGDSWTHVPEEKGPET